MMSTRQLTPAASALTRHRTDVLAALTQHGVAFYSVGIGGGN